MPGCYINDNEILVRGESDVSDSGNIYIKQGRKYAGKKVVWFILKDDT